MIKTIFICDHCGAEVDEGLKSTQFDAHNGMCLHAWGERHLCAACADKFTKWCDGKLEMVKPQEAVVETEEEQEALDPAEPGRAEETNATTAFGPARKEIDMPKAQALRKAGWTIREIADEIGVGYTTLQRRLKDADND